MELQHQRGDIIADRYRILDILGKGGIGIAYKAEHLQTGESVALKAVSLRHANDPKILELFEREAKILAQLNHRTIPRYYDYFQAGKRRYQFFYLAQQLAEGESLATPIEKGQILDEAEVKSIAIQILEVLIYLQQLVPPVIHRDIKPQNLIRRDDGEVFLVDFGAVQDVYHSTITGGSTVAGTYGYMAPEQFRGKVTLATDLYGLGTTLIALLTGKEPTRLLQNKLKIDFRRSVRVSKSFADWLDCTIAPIAEDRFESAKEALAVLQGNKELGAVTAKKLRQPPHSSISLIRDRERLILVIPPIGLRSAYSRFFALIPLIWTGFFLLMSWIFWQGLLLEIVIISWGGFALFGIFGSIALYFLATFLLSATSRTNLDIDLVNFQLQRRFLGWRYRTVRGTIQEMSLLELKHLGLSLNKTSITVCTLHFRRCTYKFGTFLTEPEKEWLVTEINEFLEKQRDRDLGS